MKIMKWIFILALCCLGACTNVKTEPVNEANEADSLVVETDSIISDSLVIE